MTLYECGVRCERTMENGMTKKVTELYLVDAICFSEAEGRITKELRPCISGDFDVVTIKRTNISEIVGLDYACGDKWFKAKVNLITLDEKTNKEKKSPVHFIVRATDIDNANDRVDKHMANTLFDYEVASLGETKIMDLFRYKVDNEPSDDDEPSDDELSDND